ncbi:hypothetical protein J437_LFUL003945, partial [Ladona fulva]
MAFVHPTHSGDIVHLNVGGTRYSTSRHTLTWIPDSFFTALLSGRISSLRDETNAIFIDRDPKLFSVILNYLRTGDIDLKNVDIRVLKHEAEFYGIAPLVKRLILCEDLTQSSCGDVLFYGYLPPPCIPLQEPCTSGDSQSSPRGAVDVCRNHHSVRMPENTVVSSSHVPPPPHSAIPPSLHGVYPQSHLSHPRSSHSRNSSLDTRVGSGAASGSGNSVCTAAVNGGSTCGNGSGVVSRSSTDLRSLGRVAHSRTASLDLRHARNSSADLNKLFRNDVGLLFSGQQ